MLKYRLQTNEIWAMSFKFLGRDAQGGRRSRMLITVKTFFPSEENPGYIEKSTFKSLMEQMKESAPGLYRNYKNLFLAFREGATIANPVTKQTHLTNQSDYYHLYFHSGRQKFETTIYEVERMGQFIKDYANDLIETDFSLDDLIEECNK